MTVTTIFGMEEKQNTIASTTTPSLQE